MLWRHGRTAWNLERRFQGQSDIVLDDVGRRQAALAAGHLARLQPSRIVSSDLRRAADTAAALAERTGVSVETDARLRETSGGTWEGRRADELADDLLYVEWSRGQNVPAGGTETRTDVARRALEVVDQVRKGLAPGALAVIVTHGGTIRSIIGSALELPYEHWRVFGGMGNCCWSVLEEGRSGWRLTEHNAGSLPEAVLGDDT